MTSSEAIRRTLIQTMERARDTAEHCPEALWARSEGPTAPSIAFHVWHVARWMDYFQDAIVGPGAEIWAREGLAARWGLAEAAMGYAATGMGMDDDVPPLLSAVPRAEILGYTSRAISGAAAALLSLDSKTLDAPYEGHRKGEWTQSYAGFTTGEAMLVQQDHSARHLGMIEALSGVYGHRGSATR